jgi:hypothetical protein
MEFTEKYLFDQQTTTPSLFLRALPIYFFPDLTNVFLGLFYIIIVEMRKEISSLLGHLKLAYLVQQGR